MHVFALFMVSKSMQRGIVDTDNSRDRITCMGESS